MSYEEEDTCQMNRSRTATIITSRDYHLRIFFYIYTIYIHISNKISTPLDSLRVTLSILYIYTHIHACQFMKIKSSRVR
jgi:hypothetical protein